MVDTQKKEIPEREKPEAVRIAESIDASDVLILDVETASRLLTENRAEILRVIGEQGPESIRALARELDRNVNAVMRDLKVLYENDVIKFEKVKNRKMPRMRHDAVVVEPLM